MKYMQFIKAVLCLCLSLVIVVACDDKDFSGLGPVPIKISSSATSAVLSSENESSDAIAFKWELENVPEADAGALTYYLQWDRKGNDFKGANQRPIGNGIFQYTFSVVELNAALSPIYGGGNQIDLDVRLYAVNPNGSAANTYYSNTIPVTVTTYRTNYVVVTGFMANPTGGDIPEYGTTNSYAGGITVQHKGGYEYIQLMALEDIDFSKTPYSVVTSNNGSVTAKGWAEGNAITHKFDLTSGFATKGSYFYVGGSSEVICGYSSKGLSTDISGANWVRVQNINVGDESVVTGDGFGNSIAGILGNDATAGSGNADGIAVFYGTDVTESSVPVDAIFYGQIVGTGVINSSKGWGYRVTDNDHYSLTDPQTGLAQPFFGAGSNTYIYLPALDGGFQKLAGTIDDSGKWVSPRIPTNVKLVYNSPITDIESGGSKLIN
ncbi:SusE outer membrane protein [bacterium A37T11]|nr:SusE outer membrane protein [bacterium A37T11]